MRQQPARRDLGLILAMSAHQTALRPSVFSTRDLAPDQQLEAWRAWHAPLIDVVPAEAGGRFPADSRLWRLDGMAIGHVRAPGLRAIRTVAHIRRDPTDHWVLSIGLRAATRIQTAGHSYAVPIRVPFVTSLAETCDIARAEDDRLHLYIARDRFPALSRVLEHVRGPLAGPLAGLLTDYLVQLQALLPDLSEADQARLPDAVGALVASCVDTSGLREPGCAAQIDGTLLQKVRQIVRRRLGSPSLGPLSIAREAGISRSRLYRLMEGEGGVARYIQNQRLEACRAAFGDPADARTIGAIAEAHGFFDPSSFSRVFRRRFAATPGEARAAAQAGIMPACARRPVTAPRLLTMRDCLRGL